MAKLSHGVWRRVLTCGLAYALALQGFIFALDIGSSAFAADGTAWAGFELCTHGGAAPAGPDAPSQGPLGNVHCVFCVAGAVFLNCPPPCTLLCRKLVFTEAAWPLAATDLVAFFVVESAWPRGPPAAA